MFKVFDLPRSQAKPSWLIFLKENNIQELFNNTNIWFDWKVYIAREVDGRVYSLSEIYRVDKGWPLIINPISDNFTSLFFQKSRNNFHRKKIITSNVLNVNIFLKI